MDATLEVRWFRQGAPPAPVQEWCTALGAERESERTDFYLHPAAPRLNVKLREGKAQAKRRLPGGYRTRFTPCVEGHAEPWRKFSFDTKTQHQLDENDRATGLWGAVEKLRYQYTLAPQALRKVIAKDPEARAPLAGDVEGSVELTRIRLEGGDPWWSVCVETEGPPDLLDAALAPAARHFFADYPAAHALTPDASTGYAGWLLRAWSLPAFTQSAGRIA